VTGVLPRRFQRNVASNYLMTGTSIAVALLTTPLLVHELGKVEYGIWVIVGSLAWYVPLLEFGFGGATVKYVAEHHARGDRHGVRRTVATSFWVLALAGLGACVLGAGLALAFPYLFDVPADVERATQLLVLLVTLDLASSMPMDTFGNVIVAFQRWELLNATLAAVVAFQALGWVIVLELGGGLVALGVVTVAISLLGQLSRAAIARRLSSDVTVAPRLFERRAVRPLAALSLWLWLTTVSKLAIRRIDVIVVGLVVGVPAAAVYAVGQKLAFLADQIIGPLARVFFPFSSEQVARRELRELQDTLVVGTRIALAIAGPACLALALLAAPAIEAWVGEGFGGAVAVVVFLAGTTAVRALTEVGLQLLPGAGQARVPALLSALEAALNVTLSVVLGRAIGLEGVALASLIAATMTHLGLMLPYICRQFGLGVAALVGSLIRAHLAPATAAVFVGVLLRRAGIESIPSVVAAGSAIAAAYVIVFAFTGLGAGERRRLLEPLRSRFGSATGGR
jgi:O-antigen/teichoic acid export membrane protein